MALEKQVVTVQIAEGLDTKTDEFQLNPGKSLVVENLRFKKTGRLTKKNGYANLPTTSNDGTFATATIRNIVSDDEYLAAICDEGVYGYSEGDSAWYKQSNFSLASKIRTQFVMQNPFTQQGEDMDITSDGTHAAFVASQAPTSFSFNRNLIIVLQDLQTGLKKSANIVNSTTALALQRVICVKSGGSVYVHVFYYDGSAILRTIFDENLDAISSGVSILLAADTCQFDLCKDSDTIFFAKLDGTNLDLRTYNFTGTQIDTNSLSVTNALRTGGGLGLGMCIDYFQSRLHVAWVNNSNGSGVIGFLKNLTSSITEANITGQISKISICQNGAGIALVSDAQFYNNETCTLNFYTGTFTTSYSFGSVTEVERVGIGAKVAEVNGKIMLLARCNEDENKSYFVYNLTDSYIAQVFSPALAEIPFHNAGDTVAMASKSIVISEVLYAAIARVSKTEPITGFGATFFSSTLSISFTQHDFSRDNQDGTRCKIGETIYLTNGATIEADRANPHDNGFVMAPKIVSVTANAGVADPDVASKTFRYLSIYEYRDSFGQITRSAPTDFTSVTTGAGTASITIKVRQTLASLKSNISGVTRLNNIVSVVLFRTANNGTTFYRLSEFLATSDDGSEVEFTDTTADSSITDNEQIYTTGGILANNPPPAARHSFSGGNRLFLVGLEEKDEIAYSKKQLFGESIAFSDLFRIRISSGSNADKSPLSAGAYMDGKVIIFRENSIYYFQGDGPNELGANDSFTEPELIASNIGCNEPRSVILTPNGIMFKSRRGIYLLDRSMSVSYVGSEVEDYNSNEIMASVISEELNEVKFFTTSGVALVYNYDYSQWSSFTNESFIDSDVWQDNIVKASTDQVSVENSSLFTEDGDVITGRLKTAWVKLNGLQDYARIWSATILGKYKSAHTLRVIVYYDYATNYSETYNIAPLVTDAQYEYRIHLKKQKCEAIQFEILDLNQVGESMELTAITLEVGLRKGSFKLPAARKY